MNPKVVNRLRDFKSDNCYHFILLLTLFKSATILNVGPHFN